MANATVLPTASQLNFFFWRGLPKLEQGLSDSSTDNEFFWSIAPLDEVGAIIDGGFLIAVTNKAGEIELDWVPTGNVSTDGLSATGVIRGINPRGTDYTVGDNDFIIELDAGSSIVCVIAAQSGELLRSAIQGLIATGAAGITFGVDAAGTVTLYRSTGVGTKAGFLRWNLGSTKTEYSNDGTTWNSIDSVTASNLVVVTGSDSTPSNLQAKTASGTGITRTVLNPGANESLEFSVNGTLANLISDVTATATEINQALDGISANVTFTNLNTLTGGGNADALHTHLSPSTSVMAYEAINALDALAEIPIEVEWFGQLTEVTSALGDSNTKRKYAIKIVPSVSSSSLTTMLFRAAEQVNGATTVGNLTISIQADSAGAPSGTAVTNGTANAISQVTQRTWNTTMASRTATWASPPSLVAGTVYWLVFECAATDSINYLKLGDASSYDENYLTFTRLTYNLDTASWGSSTTLLPLFFWFNTQVHLLGSAVCQTDANWGGRTWNFAGFAKANITAFATGLMYFETAPLTGLTQGSSYFLSATPGALTTSTLAAVYSASTPPATFSYKVGVQGSAVFRIRPGAKRVSIATGLINTTTAVPYIIWFKPDMVTSRAFGSVGVAAETSYAFGTALSDGTTSSVYGGQSSGGVVNNLLNLDSGTADTFVGVVSLMSNCGFTVTYTETGTYQMGAVLEAVG